VATLSSGESIAIVGLACRFPGAPDPDSFWALQRSGRDAIREVPAERWDREALYDPFLSSPGKTNSRWGGFLDDIDGLDAGLFGLSRGEAASLDPRHRLLLEVAWEALESAGLPPLGLAGDEAGVFVGIGGSDAHGVPSLADLNAYSVAGRAHCIAVNRVSHVFGLRGPSLGVDTGCSSSLVAVHLACQSLLSHECRLALAGGVNVIIGPDVGVALAQASLMAGDGRCKSFDAAADGYVRSEGCGLVALKRLGDARADGDPVLAVLRGSAVNHDGRARGPVTSPDEQAQAEVMRRALARGGVDPGALGFVEAHGVGTPAADRAELRALDAVLSGRAERCLVGSVKTNVGHLEWAAGIAGLIRAVQVLAAGEVPPQLHLRQPAPALDWPAAPLEMTSVLRPWPRGEQARLALVNSFGIGGTNAAVVLEEAPLADARAAGRPPFVLPLSARTDAALAALAGRWARHLQAHPEIDPAAVCHTASAGRSHFPHRLAVVGDSAVSLAAELAAAAEGRTTPGYRPGQSRDDDAAPAALRYCETRRPEAGPSGRPPRRLALPTYPFERSDRRAKHGSSVPAWKVSAELPRVRGHRVFGQIVVPAPYWIDVMLSAAQQARPGASLALAEVRFTRTLFLEEGGSRDARVVIEGDACRAESRAAGSWVEHAAARVGAPATASGPSLRELRSLCPEEAGEFYQAWSRSGVELAGELRHLARVWRGEGAAAGELAAPARADLFQVAIELLCAAGVAPGQEAAYVPIGAGAVELREGAAWAGAVVEQTARGELQGSVRFFDADGVAAGEVRGLRLARAGTANVASLGLAGAPPARRQQILVDHLRGEIAALLDVPRERVDPRRGFFELGLDSLALLDLRGRLQAALGPAHPVPATLLFEHPTPEALSAHLAGQEAAGGLAAAPPSAEAIAIVGLACRFAGADDAGAFWRLLAEGVDGTSEIPPDRWDVEAFYDPDPAAPGKSYTRRGAFLRCIDRFDADFFGITPREAVGMDPQQRLLLEVAWEALEDAGLPADSLAGTPTGVYLGICFNDYARRHLQSGDLARIDAWSGTGVANSVASGRLSHVLGLRGPNLAIDTACSSSLVAVHLACQALRRGEATVALAGGVNLMLAPEGTVYFCKVRALARDGRCKTFDVGADGYGRGEGCGVLVLKRLGDARAQGDRILAVIRGSAINHDGHAGGLTVPSGSAQEAVITAALADAGLTPGDVDYVEAHGTGTPLGDPVELHALHRALRAAEPRRSPLLVGSVKTNIGHTEAAAGIAGLIKVVLSLRHGAIPPHLHLHALNPHLEDVASALRIPGELVPWTTNGTPRVAGVSSFGFSGTNAHVIVEEAPETTAPATGDPPYLLALSARDEASLLELASACGRRLAEDAAAWPALAHAASVGRSQLPCRATVLAGDAEEALARLANIAPRRADQSPEVAFLFTGQGAQFAGMGRELLEGEPVFRAGLERCAAVLDTLLPRPLFAVLDDAGEIDQTAIAQPVLFALQYGLVELWRAWGVRPSVVAGHSVGELAAACAAGAFDLEDALRLVATRGALMQALPPGGGMAAVLAPLERVERELAGEADVAVAAVNAPAEVVLSGARGGLERVCARLAAAGVSVHRLAVSHAFHSPLIEPMLRDFERHAERMSFRPAHTDVISAITGRLAPPSEIARAGYWIEQARRPVLFAAAVEALVARGVRVFVEIGPQPTLLALGRKGRDVPDAAWLPSLRKGRGERAQMLASLGALFERGQRVDFRAVHQGRPRPLVAVPHHPFHRRRFWLENPAPTAAPTAPLHPLVHRRLRAAVDATLFEADLRGDAPAWLGDHRVGGRATLPGAAYVEMALAAGRALTGTLPSLAGLTLHEPLVLGEGDAPPVAVQLAVSPPQAGRALLRVLSLPRDGAPWTVHCTTELQWTGGNDDVAPAFALPEGHAAAPDVARLRAVGLDYGPAFRGLKGWWRREGEIVARVELPAGLETRGQTLHPALLDAALQSLLLGAEGTGDACWVPAGFERVAVHGEAGRSAWSVGRLVEDAGGERRADLWLYDDDRRPVAIVIGMRARRLAVRTADLSYEVTWRPQPADPPASDPHRWLLIADRGGMAERVVRRLLAAGHRCEVVTEVVGPPAEPSGVVDLRGLDAVVQNDASGAEVAAAVTASCAAHLQLLQALVGAQPGAVRGVWLVTAGAQAVGARPVSVAAAPLWGLAHTAAAEHPELGCRGVDLDPMAADATERLLVELGQGPPEQVALRDGVRYVARLSRAAAPVEPPLALAQPRRGVLDELQLRPAERRTPGPREVEVRIRAAGVNFRDVLGALGMYPGDPGPLGSECVGEVVAAGEGVALRVGERVMGFAPASLASHAVTSAGWVVPCPPALDDVAAATLPVAFLTAMHALEDLARVESGERVLVHAGAGGVGLAAIQVAQALGAEVYATAGSPAKRAFLAERGVVHVMDSRRLDFAEDLRRRGGVDVVLNSLSGEFIPRSLAVVRDGGRFIEIGKIGVWDAARARAVAPHVRYEAFDLGQLLTEEPARAQAMLQALAGRVARGELRPLPARSFALGEAAGAFRHLAQARHIGKVVLRPSAVRGDGGYLVTGGLGGVGLAVARWLVAEGARRVVLVGRSGPSPEAERVLAELRAHAEVSVAQADVADEGALRAALAQAEPLRGIVHAAGILEDATLAEQDAGRLARVLAPKVAGAWNLHRLSAERTLDFFVLCSSIAPILGSPGQANYAAANAFLDALAHDRRAHGLPALSVGFGPWAGVGMARAGSEWTHRFTRRGIEPLPAERCLAVLDALALAPAAHHVVLSARWPDLREAAAHVPALLGELLSDAPGRVDAALLTQLREAPPAEQGRLLHAHLQRLAARVMGLDASRHLHGQRPLQELGLDSLMAVELRNALAASLDCALSPTVLFDHPTPDRLVDHLLLDVLRVSPPEEPPAPEPLSDGELAAMVGDELAALRRARSS
jgi:acyl transferase domain-containing protein/NADPH:quinone reductase-like Zn-dependent oxidoreductase/acyl carrier protein